MPLQLVHPAPGQNDNTNIAIIERNDDVHVMFTMYTSAATALQLPRIVHVDEINNNIY